MTVIWIVVADSTKPSIYHYQGPTRPLQPVLDDELQHFNEPSSNLVTDKPGSRVDNGQGQRSAMSPSTDAHEYEKQRFARETGNFLNSHADDFDRLLIAAPAPAPCLGEMRKQLSVPVARKVSGELDKELTRLSVKELPEHLQGILNIDTPPRSAYYAQDGEQGSK